MVKRGWQFLQIPGPSNTPDRILKAIAQPTIDHRGPDFSALTQRVLSRIKEVFKTSGNVIIYPGSGTGAWEAALMNLFKPGDKVVAYETGHFAVLWKELAERIGLKVVWIASDWRRGVVAEEIEKELRDDSGDEIKGVMIVHNETSTGVTSDVKAVREVLDKTGHKALLLVDVVSSLATTQFEQDSWGVDVAICGSQKGFMMPPGLGFNAISARALDTAKQNNGSLHSYWDWIRIVDMNQKGFYPYTPATHLLYGLDAALDMIMEERMDNLVRRHRRLAAATRKAAEVWRLENQCLVEDEYSDSTTALILDQRADTLRTFCLNELNLVLGTGLGKLKGNVFRIGHLGDFNELMLIGTLAGVEMGLEATGAKYGRGGVQAAMDFLIVNPMESS